VLDMRFDASSKRHIAWWQSDPDSGKRTCWS
jgi:hypothetical protein